MTTASFVVLVTSVAVVLYAYALYPMMLALLVKVKSRRPVSNRRTDWPAVTITIPAYNEERSIRDTLDAVLSLDYPADRRHVLVVSDASTDRTDEIVREYADRGVELLRLEHRSGKTAAENAARARLRGEIVVNTDASVRLQPGSMKPLIAAFDDPTVGVASGCDVSVGREQADANVGETGYVGYEMWVRDLESAVDGIVGASGCFYASRRDLHMEIVPEALSRDFAAPLIARENGYRAVSVRDAVCIVPRVDSLHSEYRRKVRTMTRGLETLFYKRRLLNPLRHGVFAWMLFSHKLVRWLVPWCVVVSGVVIGVLAVSTPLVGLLLVPGAVTAGLAAVGWRWPAGKPLPRMVALPAYVFWGMLAGLMSWIAAFRRELNPVWEPTRREAVKTGTAPTLPE